jgi:Fe2+ transport system protein FeoA
MFQRSLTVERVIKNSNLIQPGADRASDETFEKSQENGKMNLLEGIEGQTYTIKEINTEDEEMNAFLFRLGCYTGEPVTLISKKKKTCIIVVKNSRYSIDKLLAEAIMV